METKELLEKKLAEVGEKLETALKQASESTAKLGETQKEFDQRLQKAQEESIELKQKLEALETAQNRPGLAGKENEADNPEFKKAFNAYMRKGDEKALEELKSMSVDSDPDGGFFVTPTVSNRILTRVFESSPIRQLASVESISTDSLEMAIDDEELESGWVSEREERPSTGTPQTGKKVITVHELYAEPKATQKALDDSARNIEAWLADKTAQKFGRDEASAFVAGNGVGKPRGFLTYPDYTTPGVYQRGHIERIKSGSAGAFTSDGIIDLQNALKEPFQANAVFLIKRSSFGDIRKLLDGEGQYLLGIGGDITKGQQMMLLGSPVRFADDMPGLGSGALAMAYGDFREGYTIVDRTGIRVLRDPYTGKPFVKFYTTKRVGGDVTNSEAIKLQVLSS